MHPSTIGSPKNKISLLKELVTHCEAVRGKYLNKNGFYVVIFSGKTSINFV